MSRSFLFALALMAILAACSDSFNDPNEGYEEIIDLDKPEIIPITIAVDSVYRGIDTLDIQILYRDLLLETISFNMAPTNVSGPNMVFNINREDTAFLLDTFYPIPAFDTVDLSILTTCKDYAENTSVASYNIQVIP